MEPTKFTVLVNDLLEPALKTKVADRLKFPSVTPPDFFREQSMRLKPIHTPKLCGDCGEIVTGRVVEYAVYAIGTKNQHWKKCCNICNSKTKMVNGLKDIE